MSGLVPIPTIAFRMSGPPLFPVLDEQGRDVDAATVLQGEGTVYVPDEHLPELRTHLLRCLPRVAGNQLVESHLRGWLLHSVLTFEVEALLTSMHAPGNSRGLLEVTRALGREAVSWATTGRPPSYRHRQLVGNEFSPASHAVNSALYATSIAAAATEQDHEALQGVALGAIFADLARDEPSERARIDQAAIIMRRCGVPSVGAVAGILARYARWDGGGLPRVAGPAIPLEGRCIAIASDYNLLATGADGEAPRTPYEALSEMGARAGAYDPQLLRRFVHLIAAAGTSEPESQRLSA